MSFNMKTVWSSTPISYDTIRHFLEETHKLYVFLIILGGVSVIKLFEILAFVKGYQFFFILAVKVNNTAANLTLDIHQYTGGEFHQLSTVNTFFLGKGIIFAELCEKERGSHVIPGGGVHSGVSCQLFS